jgi:hypothetical protein
VWSGENGGDVRVEAFNVEFGFVTCDEPFFADAECVVVYAAVFVKFAADLGSSTE